MACLSLYFCSSDACELCSPHNSYSLFNPAAFNCYYCEFSKLDNIFIAFFSAPQSKGRPLVNIVFATSILFLFSTSTAIFLLLQLIPVATESLHFQSSFLNVPNLFVLSFLLLSFVFYGRFLFIVLVWRAAFLAATFQSASA